MTARSAAGIGEQRSHVGLAAREQAGAQAPVGREAEAVAGLTEVLGHAGDEADGAARAGHAPVLRRTVPVGPLVRHQLVALHEPAQEVARRQQPALAAEVVAGHAPVERHELDEAHVQGALAREVDEGVEFVLDAGQEQRVELDRREPGCEGSLDAGQRVVQAAASRDAREARRVEAVQADVDPLEAGGAEVRGKAGQQTPRWS